MSKFRDTKRHAKMTCPVSFPGSVLNIGLCRRKPLADGHEQKEVFLF